MGKIRILDESRGAGVAGRAYLCFCGVVVLWLLLPGAPWATAQEPPREEALGADPRPLLELIEAHYQAGDDFRAETEMIRFLYGYPTHEAAPAVQLARAKLYVRAGRYDEAALLLAALLDSAGPTVWGREAQRLLGLVRVRQGAIELGAEALLQAGRPRAEVVSLGRLLVSEPTVIDPERAVAWSTYLPGAGFFALGQPAKGTTALALNVALAGGAVVAFLQDNHGAALVLFLAEMALYSGGRDAVRTEAERLRNRAEARRRETWTNNHGYSDLLQVGVTGRFAGP